MSMELGLIGENVLADVEAEAKFSAKIFPLAFFIRNH